jgi:hypothetical protein
MNMSSFKNGTIIRVLPISGGLRPLAWKAEMDGLMGRLEMVMDDDCGGSGIRISDTRGNTLDHWYVPYSAVELTDVTLEEWLKNIRDKETAETLKAIGTPTKTFNPVEAKLIVDELGKEIAALVKKYDGVSAVVSIGASCTDGIESCNILIGNRKTVKKLVAHGVLPCVMPELGMLSRMSGGFGG